MSTNSISDKSIPSNSDDIYCFKDDYNIIFKLKDFSLERDIHLHIFHCNPRTGQRTTILSFTFNTAFFHPGVIRLRPDDLEMPFRDSEAPALLFSESSTMKSGQKRFNEDFAMDLILLPSGNSDSVFVDYSSTVRRNSAKNLLRLSQMHPIRPDRKLLPPLLLQSFPKFYSKLALQLAANDIHRAHEFLDNLKQRNGTMDLEKSFLELTNATRIEEEKAVDDTMTTANTKTNEDLDSLTVDTKTNEALALDVKKNEEKTNQIFDDEMIITKSEIQQNTEITSQPSKVKLAKKATLMPSFSGIGIKYEDDERKLPESKESIHKLKLTLNTDATSIPPPPPLPAPRSASFVPPPPPLPAPRLASFVPPPPPLPLPSPSSNNIPLLIIPSYKPKIKNTLHWNELPVENGNNSSIWHEIANGDFETQLALNTKRFEELFCVDLGHEKMKASRKSDESYSDTKLPVVIDIRRANNVGIGLARFQKRYDDFTNLLSAIHEPDALDLDDYLTLKSILPSTEEIKNLRLIKKSDKILLDRMGKAEQFIYTIAHNNPEMISKAVEYKIFELTCWQDFSGIKEKFEMISSILDALKSSAELKIILKVALDLGNLATYEYGKAQHNGYRRNSAFGFTLDSLCRLHEVKSVDGQSNLLVFLTASLAQAHPEVLGLPGREEFKDLDVAKLWSDRQLITEYKLLQDTTNILCSEISDNTGNDFWKVANSKALKFKEHLEASKIIISDFQQTWLQTKEYFSNSHDIEDVSAFLMTVWQFFKNFETAIKQVNKHRRKSEKTESIDTFKSWSSSSSVDL